MISASADRSVGSAAGGTMLAVGMSAEEAHDWAENHLTDNVYDKAFGANAHNEVLTPLLVRLKPAVLEKLTQTAREHNSQLADMAEALIAQGLGVE